MNRFASPRERLELSEVGPASFLRLCSTPGWAVPPCRGLGCCSPSRVPEICCPAWTWKRDHKKTFKLRQEAYAEGLLNSLHDIWLLSSYLPGSDVFCSESSSSSDSDPRSRSLPPFSMLLLEPPSEVWETPNLEGSDNRMRLRRDEGVYRHKTEISDVLKTATRKWKARNSLWGLPCSGFSLCCIVHLLLFPNVLLFFSIIKLVYPLFTAGFKSSRIGLCINRHLDDVIIPPVTVSNTQITNVSF